MLYQLKRHPSESKVSCGCHGWLHGVVQAEQCKEVTINKIMIVHDQHLEWDGQSSWWMDSLPRRPKWKDNFAKCVAKSGCHSQPRQIYDGHWSSLHLRFACLLLQDISSSKSCGKRQGHWYSVCVGKYCAPCCTAEWRWINWTATLPSLSANESIGFIKKCWMPKMAFGKPRAG